MVELKSAYQKVKAFFLPLAEFSSRLENLGFNSKFVYEYVDINISGLGKGLPARCPIQRWHCGVGHGPHL